MGAWLSFLFVSPRKVVRINDRKLYIKKALGEGGFSYVFLVKDSNDKQTYALKKMLCQTDELLSTGKKEIEILSKFTHPNILRIVDHDIVVSSTVPGAQEVLMLLPFHKRGSIHDSLQFQKERFGPTCTKSPYSEKEALSIFRGICNAVSLFHQSDPVLAIRDLKPANVLLTEKDEPVLMDFGSVSEARITITSRKQALAIQEIAEQVCTHQYRAPELFNIASECTLDERTDIWSLGCVLYALVYCQSPFETATSVALAVQSPVEYHQTTFSQQTVDLIKTMLVIDANARPFIREVIDRIPQL
jgi:serine/threonine kinase 16